MASDYEKNTKIVKELFAAFNRKDTPAVLSYLDESIDWQSPATGTTVKEIPWSKPRHGQNEVSAFFKEVNDKLSLDEITYKTLIADGDCVVAEGTMSGCVCETGCYYCADWAMVFTLRNGKITRFRNYYDPSNIAAAFHAKGKTCERLLKAA
jgi:ketosteroid isomerase-like protein